MCQFKICDKESPSEVFQHDVRGMPQHYSEINHQNSIFDPCTYKTFSCFWYHVSNFEVSLSWLIYKGNLRIILILLTC
jgi:hypothetical protein